MPEYIPGAVYVSPSTNTAWIADSTHLNDPVNGYRAHRDDVDLPSDMVLVWQPNDDLPLNMPENRTSEPQSLLADIRYELNGFREELGAIEYHMLNSVYDELKQLLADDWHYPPVVNARPGLYESEDHKTWMFDFEEGGQWFLQTKPNHYESRHLPTWRDNREQPVAVKWIGELDE